MKQLYIAGLSNAASWKPHLTANINTFPDLAALAAQAQRYARAYKTTASKPSSRPPYSAAATKRAPHRKASNPAAKSSNEVEQEVELGELNHEELEDVYNGAVEVGSMDVVQELELAPAEKRGATSSSDQVMARLAAETGQSGRVGGGPKKYKVAGAPLKVPQKGPGRPPSSSTHKRLN